jgi:hypothetical protein
VANIYLHDLPDGQTYQLTDFYTGVQGITPLSPVLSWARKADKLAFVYFEQGRYDVYTLTAPATLKKQPWNPNQIVAARRSRRSPRAPTPRVPPSPPSSRRRTPGPGGRHGLPHAARLPSGRFAAGAARLDPGEERARLDREDPRLADITPPDTNEFTFKDYKATLEPEYCDPAHHRLHPGHLRRGLTGSTGIVLGDMLGNHQLGFAASLNGRINETYFAAQYVNLARRLNWAVGLTQEPYFY